MYTVSFDVKLLNRCNMNCKYCCSHSNDNSIMEIEYIVEYLQETFKSLNLKQSKINIVLLGGEVTLLPNGYMTKLIKQLNELKEIGNIHIYTNMKVFSSELNSIINQNDNVYLNLSFDTINDDLSLRTINLDTILKTIRKYNLKKKIIIHSVLTNINIEVYPNLLDLFINEGIDIFRFKLERNLGYYLHISGMGEHIRLFFEDIVSRYDIKFVSNMVTATIFSREEKIGSNNLSIITQIHNRNIAPSKMYRNTFQHLKISKNKLFELYR